MPNNNLDNIKAVVIMLDGCILDLNRFRFNYYKHLCEEYKISIEREEFYNQLENMYTMYNHLPLAQQYDSSELNDKIETEMYDYLSHKGVYAREGLFELLDYLNTKDIKIAVISTHSTKKAIDYLKLTRVYSKVHYIIGSDTKIKPLPSDQFLKAISIQFDVQYSQMLVISPILALNKVAHSLKTNVYYFKDLIEPREAEKETSIKTLYSFFDILNIFLFNHIYDPNMYSSILGMNDVKDTESLNEINNHLKEVYNDEPKILEIIEDTYQIKLNELDPNHNSEENLFKKIDHVADNEIFKEEPEEVISDTNDDTNYIDDSQESILSLNPQQTTELTSAWNKILSKEMHEEVEEEYDEYDEYEDQEYRNPYIYVLSEFVYSFIISFLILIIGIIIAVVYMDYIAIFPYPNIIITYYIEFLNIFMKYITSFISISTAGRNLLHIFLFNAILIFIIKMIYFAFNKEKILYK